MKKEYLRFLIVLLMLSLGCANDKEVEQIDLPLNIKPALSGIAGAGSAILGKTESVIPPEHVIPFVSVTVYDKSGTVLAETSTDQEGKFFIAQVLNDDYFISVLNADKDILLKAYVSPEDDKENIMVNADSTSLVYAMESVLQDILPSAEVNWREIDVSGLISKIKGNEYFSELVHSVQTDIKDGNGISEKTHSILELEINENLQIVTSEAGYTMAVSADNSLWGWGINDFGTIGDGSFNKKNHPVEIGGAWLQVAAGLYHTAAIRSDGTLWAWGYNAYGQLGDNSAGFKTSPGQIDADIDWVSVEAGERYTIAKKSDGTYWGFGLADDSPTNENVIWNDISEDVDILGIGDSIAGGTVYFKGPEHEKGPAGDELSQIWVHLIKNLDHNLTFYNAGIPRNFSADVAQRIKPLLQLRKPEQVYLHVGINDVVYNRPLENYLSNLTSILSQVRDSGAELIIGQILPRKVTEEMENIKLWNAELEKWCLNNQVKLAPTYLEMSSREIARQDTLNEAYAVDNTHPNVEGYKKLGMLYAHPDIPTRKRIWGGDAFPKMSHVSLKWFVPGNGALLTGNEDSGSISLPLNSTADSPVEVMEAGNKIITIKTKMNSGDIKIQYKIKETGFSKIDNELVWRDYNGSFNAEGQFIQIRLVGKNEEASVVDEITLEWNAVN